MTMPVGIRPQPLGFEMVDVAVLHQFRGQIADFAKLDAEAPR